METDPVIADHLEWMQLRGLSEKTIYDRRLNLARLERHLGKQLLRASRRELLAWRAGLRLSRASVINYVSHVREFYRWAAGLGLIDESPADAIPVPELSRRLPRPISEECLAAALAQARLPERPWLVLAGWAGLRCKEIALLRRENVLDQAAEPVLIIAADATKGTGERIVPLSPFVLEELHRAGLPPAGWVFRRADGRPGPNRPEVISHRTSQFLADCGIRATLHMARHRFGTQAYASCHDLRVVQELMGHSKPSTTALYADWSRADARAAVNALPTGA